MKRHTAAIFNRYPSAWDLDKVLRAAGIDSKIVTKHAVQVLPDQLEAAKRACEAERTRRRGSSATTV
jgi:hypothetical protein